MPPWAAAAFAALNGNIAALNGNIAAQNGNIAALTGNVAALTGNFARMDATLANRRICARNAAALAAPPTPVQPLFPLQKEVHGLGLQLPGPGLLGVVPPAAQPVSTTPALLGAGGAGIFPATVAGVNTLTHRQLRTLSIWYNDGFGIVAGHTEAQRQQLFREWLCGR